MVTGCAREDPAPPSSSTYNEILANDSLAMLHDYNEWAKTHPAGGAMRLDLSNVLHERVLRNRLMIAGKTVENSPELFHRMAVARDAAIARKAAGQSNLDAPAARPWCIQALPFNETPSTSGHFMAKSKFSCGGTDTDGNDQGISDYASADITTYVTDTAHTNLTVLNHDVVEDFGVPGIDTGLIPADIQRAPSRVVFMDSITIAYNDLNDFSGYQPMDANGAVPDRKEAVVVSHPHEIQNATVVTSDPHDIDKVIRVCIFRESQTDGGRDCDYGAVKKEADGSLTPFPPGLVGTGIAAAIPTPAGSHVWTADKNAYFGANTQLMSQNGSPVWAFVPIDGTYDAGAAFGTECQNFGTQGTIQMFLKETGGGCAGVPVGGAVSGQISLPWTDGMGGKPVATNSLWRYSGLVDFGSTCLRFFQDVSLVLTITNPAMACRGARNVSYELPGLDFRNSCLAEGTMVTLQSGKSVPVEKVAEGDRVIADSRGGTLTVKGISHGYEPYPMVRIRDDRGQRVMVTETHPMVLESGTVVAAKKLAVGDRVLTRKGATKLVSVERVKYDGRVFNFVLGTPDELAGIDPDHRTLFANGFLVGDNVMQQRLEELSKPTRAARLAKLPSAWLADYHNAVIRKTVAEP